MSELHEGNKSPATIITSKPPSVVTEKEVQAPLSKTGGAAPAAAAPAASIAAPPRTAAQTAAPAQQPVSTIARRLPGTAGSLPTIGLIGLASVAAGALATRRRRAR